MAPGFPRRFTTEQVIHFRQRFRDGETIPVMSRAEGVCPSTLRAIIRGKFYREIPGAVPKTESFRRFSPEQVADIRDASREGLGVRFLAEYWGCHPRTITLIVQGKSYADLPGSADISGRAGVDRRRFTNDEVVRLRRSYWSRQITMPQIAREYDVSTQTIWNMLRGHTYKDLPNAVPLRIRASLYRSLDPRAIRRRQRKSSQTFSATA